MVKWNESGTRMQRIGLLAGVVLAIGLVLFFDLDIPFFG